MHSMKLKMFTGNVDTIDHPSVQEFKQILMNIARTYRSRLVLFHVKQGTVFFQFDNDELNTNILEDIIGFKADHAKERAQGCL